ncbi:MAG: type I-U CRISPR-associated helicase/endonuclease Cas3 [Pseudomonadota bacterium]
MAELAANRFAEYFEALWGHRPFAWQSTLARRVIEGNGSAWPQAIALPTAAGKTACIDIAVYAMAARAFLSNGIVRTTAPRRVFFVVDRRVIVDEAFDRSCELARRLSDAAGGVLKEVADNLCQIAYGRSDGDWTKESPLLPFQLRGGMYRSEAWARSPLQPIVVASTVDQVGSRLLFRAYGRGPGMWPVYAGLVANDSLILLDEAHCAKPFMETLHAVGTYRRIGKQPIQMPYCPVVLSATPPDGLANIFRDESDEPTDPQHVLGKRQLANKPAMLIPPIQATRSRSSDPFVVGLAEQAEALVSEDRKAVVVFANRVATARAAHALLQQRGCDSVLLTGRMRALDKDDTVRDRLKPLATAVSDKRTLDKPLFVVATQTLEVGADLDFDALVTECASLDALRQRFGRLNRKGRPIEARAAILIREEQAKNSDEDPVYGSALSATWNWLSHLAAPADPPTVDMGIAQLGQRLPAGDELRRLNAPSTPAVVLLPAHLDALAQTSPAPMPSPDIAYFLHGAERASADVQVCWRADLSLSEPAHAASALDVLSYCPPASAECVAVPIWRMRRWLAGHRETDLSSDVEGEHTENEESSQYATAPRLVIRWRGRRNEESRLITDPADLRPGDVLVLPANTEGWKDLGDFPAASPDAAAVTDWGDRAYRTQRAKALLRLHPALVASWPVCDTVRNDINALLEGVGQKLEETPDELVAEVRACLKRLAQEQMPAAWQWLLEVAESLARDRRLSSNLALHPFGGLILRGSKQLPTAREQADTFSDEDDVSASGTVPVPLEKHLPGVAAFARRFADGAGLEDEHAAAIELAGRLHDLGKADPRFQALLRGGQRFFSSHLLAKSGSIPQGRNAFERARRLSGYPQGARHELLSVRLAEAAGDVLPDNAFRDLVLHLVASHHGYCRPLAPVVLDAQPADIGFDLLDRTWSYQGHTGLERLDSGVLQRFWHLTRDYGWWDLAWLEAVLRLADHRRSEWEEANYAEEDAGNE